MPLLIDGYNLLHVTGIFGGGEGPGTFQRTREALLNFLAASLDEDERTTTTVVFDAAEAPPGLPDTLVHKQLQVRYARDYPDADSLIEELIEAFPAPRTLLVVSSDRRIQRAARRRRAKFAESDAWYAELWQRRTAARQHLHQTIPEKPIGQLTPAEVAYWVAEFSKGDLPEMPPRNPTADAPPPAADDLPNPFPPGYGEDLLE